MDGGWDGGCEGGNAVAQSNYDDSLHVLRGRRYSTSTVQCQY